MVVDGAIVAIPTMDVDSAHIACQRTVSDTKDIIIKDKVIEMAKLRKMFMPSFDTRGQQRSRVVKGRGTPLHYYFQNVPTYNKEQFLLLF